MNEGDRSHASGAVARLSRRARLRVGPDNTYEPSLTVGLLPATAPVTTTTPATPRRRISHPQHEDPIIYQAR